MFELILEVDLEDLKLGIESYGYTLGNITINGQYGSLTSKRDKAPYQECMIFLSLSLLLDDISTLIKNHQKQYIFEGIDSSFSFYIFNNRKGIMIADSKRNKVAETNTTEFIQTIWKSVDKFVTKHRPYLEEGDGVTIDLNNSIAEFKTQFADILMDKTKS